MSAKEFKYDFKIALTLYYLQIIMFVCLYSYQYFSAESNVRNETMPWVVLVLFVSIVSMWRLTLWAWYLSFTIMVIIVLGLLWIVFDPYVWARFSSLETIGAGSSLLSSIFLPGVLLFINFYIVYTFKKYKIIFRNKLC